MRAQSLCIVLSAFLLSIPIPLHAQATSDPWRSWGVFGGGPDNIHYSSLDQINRENVHSLQVAWTFDSGDQHPKSEMECNPIVVDGVLYATTPNGDVVALDAATGTLHWRFDANEGLRNIGKVRNRGVTYWSDGTDRRIFVGVRQYLFSLDAQTGKPITAFGKAGRIDLREGLGREPLNWVTMTSPAVVYKDLVIVGGCDELKRCPPRREIFAPTMCTADSCDGPFIPSPTPVNSATRHGPRRRGLIAGQPTIGRE